MKVYHLAVVAIIWSLVIPAKGEDLSKKVERLEKEQKALIAENEEIKQIKNSKSKYQIEILQSQYGRHKITEYSCFVASGICLIAAAGILAQPDRGPDDPERANHIAQARACVIGGLAALGVGFIFKGAANRRMNRIRELSLSPIKMNNLLGIGFSCQF